MHGPIERKGTLLRKRYFREKGCLSGYRHLGGHVPFATPGFNVCSNECPMNITENKGGEYFNACYIYHTGIYIRRRPLT